jgi:hypothetical protein
MAVATHSAPKKRTYQFDWKEYDQTLINRGDISIYLEILDHMETELKILNTKKRGRKFLYPDCLFVFCAIIRYIFHISFRQLEGFLKFLSLHYGFNVPQYSTIHKRIQTIDLEQYFPAFDFSDSNISIAIDSSGLKQYQYSDWLRSKHGAQSKPRKGWIKIHFVVEVKDHCVVAVKITDEHVGDSTEAIPLLTEAQKKCAKLDKAFGDGAYDSKEVFNYCAKHKIDPIIRVRKNSSPKARGSPARAAVVRALQNYGFANWKKMKEYGKRWSVERAYSVFKGYFGDAVCSRTFEHICVEVRQKIALMNIWLHQLSKIKV